MANALPTSSKNDRVDKILREIDQLTEAEMNRLAACLAIHQHLNPDGLDERFAIYILTESLETIQTLARFSKGALDRMTPKPRSRDRDATIVDLHDGSDQVSFGCMGRRLQQINPLWVGPDSRPLKSKAAEKAYSREKKRQKREQLKRK